ncbi:MAG: hypothetical protein DRO39_06860 [Thermoprotei archaeon]|nr:MAG: hypothetical protein DRO39_06860 [Thermoprotei archaeon]
MVLFFTLPPNSLDYPYILINANRPRDGLNYIMAHRKAVEIVIIDAGVEIFRNRTVKEYPGGPESWIRRLVRLYDSVRRIVPHAKIYVTCPDYPDDYHPRNLWLSDRETNIERTIYNVLKCVDWYGDVRWLIPVQGWNRVPSSLLISLEYLEQLGVLKRYEYLAVANLCVEPSKRIIKHAVQYVHHWLHDHGYSDKKIHIFGVKISVLDIIAKYATSVDNLGYTKPVSQRLHDVFPWSCKSEDERELFFCEYMIQLAMKGVPIPITVFEQCVDRVLRMLDSLVRRYPSKRNVIADLINAVLSDLGKILGYVK